MNKLETITIKEYLDRKGTEYQEKPTELITRCLFSGCDNDSKGKEAHLYFSKKTGQYHCKKCNEKGNVFTLAEYLGDQKSSVLLNPKKPKKNGIEDKVLKIHEDLTDNIRQYLNRRGIADEVIDQHKIGYGTYYGEKYITIPIKDKSGAWSYLKLRQDPVNGSNKITYPKKGAHAQIYGWDTLATKPKKLVICEGELDRLTLLSHDTPSITSTHGAGTFKEEWIEDLLHIPEIYICFDNDDAGIKGSLRVASLLHQKGHKNIHLIELPTQIGPGGDVTDYITKSIGTINELFSKYSTKYDEEYEEEKLRFKSFENIPDTSFTQWKDIITYNFPELYGTAEICLSILSQLLIKDITNPFGLVLIDMPASGKTICLNFFSKIPDITYPTDKMSPAAFISNAANVSKEKLAEVDLLPRIKFKTLIVRDLATIFSKREEDMKDLLGTLTRVLDGEGLTTETGVHGQRSYEGNYIFMMLAASTPPTPRVWKIMGQLGGRLFFINMNSPQKDEVQLAKQNKDTSFKKKENACRDITTQFVQNLYNKYPKGCTWNKDGDHDDVLIIIARCAQLLSHLRGVLNHADGGFDDFGDKVSVLSTPTIEQPNRVNQLLYNMARGHALVVGRTNISFEDLGIVLKVTLESADLTRVRLIKLLITHKGDLNTNKVIDELNVSESTARRYMSILCNLGICEEKPNGYNRPIQIREKFEWFVSDECGELLEQQSYTMTD